MIEQRRHTRAPLQVTVAYVVKGAAESREGTSTDISVGGMFVQATSPAAFGAEMLLPLREFVRDAAVSALERKFFNGRVGFRQFAGDLLGGISGVSTPRFS